MANRRLVTTLILLLALCVSCSRSRESEALKYKVIAVADGDTITVLDATNKPHGVRLQGIDAPEGGQAFGTVSRQHLSDLLFGRDVTLEGDKTDRYGRLLCKVLVDGHDANLEQIDAGFAWFYRQYENELSGADRERYSAAENQAHVSKLGLWSDPAPTPPWQYRHPVDPVALAQQRSAAQPSSGKGPFIGNRRSRIYHWPGCPYYDAIAPHNREYFKTREEAEKAGYRPARNCDH